MTENVTYVVTFKSQGMYFLLYFVVLFCVIGRSCNKYHFGRDKTFVMIKTCLWWQTCVCRDKDFVMTSLLLSLQTRVCCNESMLAVTNFCHDKRTVLSWQTRVFLRQKLYFWQLLPMIVLLFLLVYCWWWCCCFLGGGRQVGSKVRFYLITEYMHTQLMQCLVLELMRVCVCKYACVCVFSARTQL